MVNASDRQAGGEGRWEDESGIVTCRRTRAREYARTRAHAQYEILSQSRCGFSRVLDCRTERMCAQESFTTLRAYEINTKSTATASLGFYLHRER